MTTLEQIVEAYGLEWDAFADALDDMEKEAFAALITHAKQHAYAGSKRQDPNMFESVVLSILVEHQKELMSLQGLLLPVEVKTCPRCHRTTSVEDFLKGSSEGERAGILCQYCQQALGFVHEKREKS